MRAALGAAGAFGGIIVLSVLKSRPDLPTGEQKAVDATEKRHDAFEALVKQSPKQPPLLLREPPLIHELPAEVPGPWRIDRADFTSFVAGPRREPKPVWIARPSMNTSIIGFAPDRTLFRVDDKTVCGLRDGVELWAFEVGRLRGITPGGHIWLNAEDYSSEIEKSPLACFNSRGEGGAVSRAVKLPPNLIPVESPMHTLPPKPLGTCSGGVVTLHGSKAAISVDGNCAEWGIVQDKYGRFYTGTDRNTIYCFDAGGKVLWTYKSGIPVDSKPKFSLGDPVFTTKEGIICLRDGARRWFVPLQYCGIEIIDKTGTMSVSSHSTSTLGYHSYLLTSAIDHDGRLLWTLPLPGFSMVLDPEGRLNMEGATSDNDQYLICLA
jgi:hypothetical protein